MGKLSDLISERRRRQENPDRVVAIFRIIIDPITKKEATDVPRQASVIGGPRLQQEAGESHRYFLACRSCMILLNTSAPPDSRLIA
jgi:hypothetical protein